MKTLNRETETDPSPQPSPLRKGRGRSVGSLLAGRGSWTGVRRGAGPIVCAGVLWLAIAAAAAQVTIVAPKAGSARETLAAREVMRYYYLRTGVVAPVVAAVKAPSAEAVVVARKDRPVVTAVADAATQAALSGLKPQEFLLKTITRPSGRKLLLVAGGDDVGTLYGAYRLAECLGVRFYLHGDVVPETRLPPGLPQLDETNRPLFGLRGIQPFHDFGEGPDWWSTDDYKAVIGQLPKLRMNFIGLHTYPESNPVVGPEASVWIGLGEDADAQGRVRFSYPAGYMTTRRGWRIKPMRTSEFTCGADQLFAEDDWGSEALRGYMGWPDKPEDCNEVFDRTGTMFKQAFTFARGLGVKTCVGTEVPLSIPKRVGERLKARGKDPADPAVVREVYEGIFQRIMKAYPLDYYWIWTSEAWTAYGASDAEVAAAQRELLLAWDAAQAVRAPFTLATCGWVLGPPKDRAQFDRVLPKAMPFSCINRAVGREPVEPQFAKLAQRPKWAIPWLEDDPNLLGVQLWAGRMLRDAVDAHRYGCDGLMGIHWRTKILAPNVAALASAGWRLPAGENATGPAAQAWMASIYLDWAQVNFGSNVAPAISAIFRELDCQMPEPSHDIGQIVRNQTPWEEVRKRYEFVEELAGLLSEVRGAGNLERFDYWRNTFGYLRAMARLGCTLGQLDIAMAALAKEPDPEKKKQLALSRALPQRQQLPAQWQEMMTCLLAAVGSSGELGTVSDLEQVARPGAGLDARYDSQLQKALGEPLPPLQLARTYAGPARIIVPTARTLIAPGESLAIRVIVLLPENRQNARTPDVEVCWRPLGRGKFTQLPGKHLARSVYEVKLPPLSAKTVAIEYYIRAASGPTTLLYPATAPDLNQTVLVGELGAN